MTSSNNHQSPHLTNSVIMVRPVDFAFNEQTGLDNEFQHRPTPSEQAVISQKVMAEFEQSIQCLQALGIEVLILEKQHTDKHLPDAVFPNNWFSTRADDRLIIYPMKTENRRDEVQIPQLKDLVCDAGYKLAKVVDLRRQYSTEVALEGTGSLIFHHPSNHLFAALSERCQKQALTSYADEFGYQLVQFNTASAQGSPIYHTNVLMSCGEDFAVITEEVISTGDNKKVLSSLSECLNDIIIITEEQMSRNFCGNILQLIDPKGQSVIALSKSAYLGFSASQRKRLEKHGSLAICEIPTIERIGGGSTRCMLAENFLTKR
jgi:hypothetical protein